MGETEEGNEGRRGERVMGEQQKETRKVVVMERQSELRREGGIKRNG